MDENDGNQKRKSMYSLESCQWVTRLAKENNLFSLHDCVDKTSTFKKAQWKLLEISVALFFIAFKNNMSINPLIRS